MSGKRDVSGYQERQKTFNQSQYDRQLSGLPALSDEQQQLVVKNERSKSEGFFAGGAGVTSPLGEDRRNMLFIGNIAPVGSDTLTKNKRSPLTAIPQYDISANSAYRQQMSLRKIRANKL